MPAKLAGELQNPGPVAVVAAVVVTVVATSIAPVVATGRSAAGGVDSRRPRFVLRDALAHFLQESGDFAELVGRVVGATTLRGIGSFTPCFAEVRQALGAIRDSAASRPHSTRSTLHRRLR
ncbi:MAG: hypothetical protein KF890_15530 [Nitrospira sp.]|nr:hypothetical protein [Nitrospira sp.]